MLPLSLLKSAINHPMLVELKNGETYNGHLANCDAWMNIYLTQVICTSRDGDRFWKMPECYIRGSTIKYLRISENVVENFKDDSSNRMNMKGRGDQGSQRGRGGSNQRGGRGNSSQRGNRQGRQGQMSNSTSNSSIGKPFNKQQRK